MSPRKPTTPPPPSTSANSPAPADSTTVNSLEELGLSLTELSATYAAMIGVGNDPYQPVPEAPDQLGRTLAEVAAEPQADAGRVPPLSRPDDDAEITPRSILEAMLFVGHPANQPLESSQVAALMRGVTAQEIDELVGELNQDYQEQAAPYRIESCGAGYRLVLLDEFSKLADKFLGRVREARLTQAAVDVLAIVAYNQPITREQVDRLRGRPCGAILAQLLRRDLLRIDRVESERREYFYRTTPRFLELFGLDSIDELPRSHEIGPE